MITGTKAEKLLSQIKADRQRLINDYSELAQQVTGLKRSTARGLREMVEQAVKMLKRKGCQVTLAGSAQEAQEQVFQILSESKKVLLSKDPIFTEVEIAPFLRSKSVELVYTDLGESIAHLPVDVHPRLATINMPLKDGESILKIKEDIREQASQIDYGITGADAVCAQTGTIVLLESEGNVRLTSNLPYNHIVVVGMEKILPSMEDALAVCRASSIYGLGKDMLNYISFISGPSRTADIEFRMVQGMHGPKEVYVILVDNGRLAVSERGDLNALMCLHCGGCLVDCPAYLKEGMAKGYRYTGKRKAVLAKFMANDFVNQKGDSEACLACGACDTGCPVGINL